MDLGKSVNDFLNRFGGHRAGGNPQQVTAQATPRSNAAARATHLSNAAGQAAVRRSYHEDLLSAVAEAYDTVPSIAGQERLCEYTTESGDSVNGASVVFLSFVPKQTYDDIFGSAVTVRKGGHVILDDDVVFTNFRRESAAPSIQAIESKYAAARQKLSELTERACEAMSFIETAVTLPNKEESLSDFTNALLTLKECEFNTQYTVNPQAAYGLLTQLRGMLTCLDKPHKEKAGGLIARLDSVLSGTNDTPPYRGTLPQDLAAKLLYGMHKIAYSAGQDGGMPALGAHSVGQESEVPKPPSHM